jgi:hypothetical protein
MGPVCVIDTKRGPQSNSEGSHPQPKGRRRADLGQLRPNGGQSEARPCILSLSATFNVGGVVWVGIGGPPAAEAGDRGLERPIERHQLKTVRITRSVTKIIQGWWGIGGGWTVSRCGREAVGTRGGGWGGLGRSDRSKAIEDQSQTAEPRKPTFPGVEDGQMTELRHDTARCLP